MDNLFSTSNICDKMFTSEFDERSAEHMILYAYMDNQTAQRLFKYFVGTRFNVTEDYRNQNPLQVPITLYETRENAKILATPTNNQLVAFSISNNAGWLYDEFDLSLKNRIKSLNVTMEQYKKQAVIWREKKKHNSFEYIAYTIRNKNTIQEIQLQDWIKIKAFKNTSI